MRQDCTDIIVSAPITLAAQLPLALSLCTSTLGSEMPGLRHATDGRDGSCGLLGRIGKLAERTQA